MTEFLEWLRNLDNNAVTIMSLLALGATIKMWLRAEIDKVDMQQTKNFLTRTLADIERGVELTEVEELRFKETYKWYIDHKGNTYIKDKYEELKEKKLI
jgi:hypothetical protein